MIEGNAKFNIGEIIVHQLYDYRGVIIDVDPFYTGTDEWYKEQALTRPSKAQPWYHVLVDGSDKETYVAESHLMLDHLGGPVVHPWLNAHATDYSDDSNTYVSLKVIN